MVLGPVSIERKDKVPALQSNWKKVQANRQLQYSGNMVFSPHIEDLSPFLFIIFIVAT